jgi:hypothetical protein
MRWRHLLQKHNEYDIPWSWTGLKANKLFALVQLQLLAPLSNNSSNSKASSNTLPLGIKYLALIPAFKARIALIYVMLLCKMDQLYILVLRLERLKLCQGFSTEGIP